MLKHYLVVAIRNLGKQRLHSALSILVLGLGLTCFLAASLFALYLDSYERGFAKRDRTYVLYQSSSSQQLGYRAELGRRSGSPLAEQLAIEIPGLEAVARQQLVGANVLAEGHGKTRPIAATDAAWLDIFDVKLLSGDAKGALARHDSAIVTRRAAMEIFGSTDVVGRPLTLGAYATVEVTIGALIEDFEGPSHLAAGALSNGVDLMVSWDVLEALFPQTRQQPAFAVNCTTYLLLPAKGSLGVRALNDRLAAFAHRPWPYGAKIELQARPVATVGADDIQKRFEGVQAGVPLPFKITEILNGLALLVLGVGCLNFVNLMTARAIGRAREIGVRKSVGAAQHQIVAQDLSQTALIVVIGIALALLSFAAVVRFGESAWRVFIDVPWSRAALWGLLAAVLGGVTVVAGIYPATVLARVQPVEALRLGTMRAGPRPLRTTLVVVQVAASVFLAIVLLVMFRQGDALRTALLGRFGDPYVVVLWPPLQGRYDVIANELRGSPAVLGVAASSRYPFMLAAGGMTKASRTAVDLSAPASYELWVVDYDYFDVMRVPLLAGRAYSREYSDDVTEFTNANAQAFRAVIDRRAARSLGWANPTDAVGQSVYTGARVPTEIIGVVESVPTSVRPRESDGQVYYLNTQLAQVSVVKVSRTNTDAALAHIDDVWKKFAPSVPVQRQFLDDAFADAYSSFTLAARVLAGLAIFGGAIAAVGLFALAAYVTRRRTREIGVRKSQGASATQILRLLLWDFAKPVFVGNLIAWPFALIAARAYIELFTAQMPLTPAPFAITLLASLLISGIAVAGYVWSGARVRPMVALRED